VSVVRPEGKALAVLEGRVVDAHDVGRW